MANNIIYPTVETINEVNHDLHLSYAKRLEAPTNMAICIAAFNYEDLYFTEDLTDDQIQIITINDYIVEGLTEAIIDNLKKCDLKNWQTAKESFVELKKNFIIADMGLKNFIDNHSHKSLINKITNIIAYREFAKLTYRNHFYNTSLVMHCFAFQVIANISTSPSKDDELIKSYIDINIKKANDARWQGHVEQQRRKYLDLDEQRQRELGKKLTIKSVATWIYEHHNQDDLEYETIRDHLSKARKGIFTND